METSTDLPQVKEFINGFESGEIPGRVSMGQKTFYNEWLDYSPNHSQNNLEAVAQSKVYYFRFYDQKKANINVGTLANRYQMGSYRSGTIWNPHVHDWLPEETTIRRSYTIRDG